MLTSSDFKELLKIFEKHKIRYLIVGGYAVMKYTEPRFTKDLDILISTKPINAKSVYEALKNFGAPLENLTIDDFKKKGYVYQMGRPPLRVDILMSISGVDFDEAWKRREKVELEGNTINFISRKDLIRSKESTGRTQDKLDIKRLKQAEELEET